VPSSNAGGRAPVTSTLGCSEARSINYVKGRGDMKSTPAAVLVALGLAGCATPIVTLRNDATGQVATCGGGSAGSILGGAIGYSIEKGNDEKCVKNLEAAGFKRTN